MHKITHIQLEKNPLSWKILHWRRGQRGRLISAVALSGTGDHYHHHPGRQRRSINSERGWTPHLGWNCQLWKCSLCTGTLSLYFPLSDSFWAISSESQFLRQPWLILCPWNLKIKSNWYDSVHGISAYILVSTNFFLRAVLKLFWFKNTRTKHRLTVFQKNWESLKLGSIPNDHMPSQKDPKISIEWRCSTIFPWCQLIFSSAWFLRSVHSSFQLQKLDWPNSVKIWRSRTCLFLNMFLSEVIPF